MADLIFSPSSQPALSCILSNFNVVRIDSIRKSLIGSVDINADELLNNVNALIFYINLSITFYNLEGANRVLGFYLTAGNVIYTTPIVATATSTVSLSNIVFNNIAFNVALAAATSALNFVGYRMITQ